MMKGTFFIENRWEIYYNLCNIFGEAVSMRKLKKALAVFILLLILCGNMAGITVSAYESYGDFEYEVLDDGTVKMTKYTGNAEIIDIPGEIDGRKVKQIGSL